MFSRVTAFNNGDISKWDVSRVTTMEQMFSHASAFNGDISKWDVSRVTSMSWMFYSAESFSLTLCGVWRLGSFCGGQNTHVLRLGSRTVCECVIYVILCSVVCLGGDRKGILTLITLLFACVFMCVIYVSMDGE